MNKSVITYEVIKYGFKISLNIEKEFNQKNNQLNQRRSIVLDSNNMNTSTDYQNKINDKKLSQEEAGDSIYFIVLLMYLRIYLEFWVKLQ